MRLKTLWLDNVYSFGEGTQCSFVFDGESSKTLIVGKNLDDPGADSNGAGKSNILNSIYWIVLDEVFQEENKDSIIRLGQAWCRGKLEMVDPNGVTMVINRGRGAGKRKFLELWYNGENKTADTPEKTQAEILKYLQISSKLKPAEYTNDFINTTYFSSDVAKGFMGKKTTSKERFQLVERFLNLKTYSVASDIAKAQKAEIMLRVEKLLENLAAKEQYCASLPEHTITDNITQVQAGILQVKQQIQQLNTQILANNDRLIQEQELVKKQQAFTLLRNNFMQQLQALEDELERNKQQTTRETQALADYNKMLLDTQDKEQAATVARSQQDQLAVDIAARENQVTTLVGSTSAANVEATSLRNQLATQLKCPACAAALMYSAGQLAHIDVPTLAARLSALNDQTGATTIQINVLQAQITELRQQQQAHTNIIANATAAANALCKLRTAAAIEVELNRITLRNTEIATQYNALGVEAETQVKAAKAEIDALAAKLQAMATDFNHAQATAKLAELQSIEVVCVKNLGQYEEQLRSVGVVKAEIQVLQGQVAAERELAEIQGFWEVGFRQLKMDIIDQFLPDFEVRVNELLSKLQVSLRISFDTQKEKANVSKKDRAEGRAFKEEFSVEVFKEGKEPLPYGLMSKGQRGRIGSCVGMALRELTQERGNNVFDFFFLDEIADALDESGLRELVALLDSMPGQKLVISHNDFLKDFFEDRITVEIENDVSTIRNVA